MKHDEQHEREGDDVVREYEQFANRWVRAQARRELNTEDWTAPNGPSRMGFQGARARDG
jgi:hypothetical protein